MFKRILVAVDGSEHSLRATDYSISLAKKYSASVDALYVIDAETARQEALKASGELEIEQKRKMKIEPVRERLDEGMVIFGTHILHGDPGPTIVDFANEREFDCVVIGSRGL